MEDTYPPGPSSVPADLTKPTAAYKRHAYLAVAGLLFFVIAYFALAGWFAWTSYRLLSSLARNTDAWIGLVVGGVGAAFLAVFMLKAVIPARSKNDDKRDHEITAADHPRLFAFFHRLADEAGAPRPHRVFLTPGVNAAVFYDLTIANLLFPSKKNLVIGLGLVNVLTLAEIKAVLAHEFGHFSQRTMAVGRWVYTAQQIAGHIVAKRDGFDDALQALSRFDIRVAWIGWILRIIVWSIRSLVDTVFGWVVLAERALSREMELQADLVAVSLTGSDALVHALYRLEAADEAFDRALGFTGGEVGGGRAVADIFAIQSRMLHHKRTILADPTYGEVPPLPADPATHRVFKEQLAHPPRMWSTHPPSELREANAKRVYVSAPLDARPGWVLFDDPAALRAKVTAEMLSSIEKPLEKVELEETLAKVDKAFDRRFFDPEYRGVYLGRSSMRAAETVDELYGPAPAAAECATALQALYPSTLSADLAQLRELASEKAALEALRKGILEAPGRVVRFRGQDRKRKELPKLIADVERELTEARERVAAHDRQVRATHLEAARALGGGWADYLRGLASLVHYADHAEADIDDAAGHVNNVVSVVTADGKVTDTEISRLVRAGEELYEALDRVYGHAGEVEIGEVLAKKLEIESWKADLEEFKLNPPQAGNIGNWLDAAMTWVSASTSQLGALHNAALEELLRVEEEVSVATSAGTSMGAAPPPPRVPGKYRVLLPGGERPRQERLGWWDRFQIADGFFPAAARFTVAGAIVGGVLWAGRAVGGEATIIVYNGLGRAVAVDIGGTHVDVAPHSHREVEVESGGSYTVIAKTAEGGLIESFEAGTSDDFAKYVYNVGSASPLIETTYTKDASDARPPRLTTDRWFETRADRIHDELPSQVQSTGDSVSVLASLADEPPSSARQGLPDSDVVAMALTHARWEPAGSRDLETWIEMVPEAQLPDLLRARIFDDPDDVIALRKQQEIGGPEACTRQRARAAELPDNPTWQYLAARCAPEAERDAALAAVAERFPDAPWSVYSMAALDEYAGRWDDAAKRYQQALDALPQMREELALRAARCRRAAAPADDAYVDDLVPSSPVLAMFLALEKKEQPEEAAMRPWWLLAQGRIEDADQSGGDDENLMFLIAASDGAPIEIANRALGVQSEKLDPFRGLLGYALALRTGKDPEPYLARATDIGEQYGPRTKAFLAALRRDVTPAALEKADAELGTVPIELRARLYSAAAVALGEQCPPAWRQLARRALFRLERPYFKAS